MLRATLGLALASATLALAACGGDTDAEDPVARAAAKSIETGTYRFDIVLNTDVGRATGRGAGDRASTDETIDFGPAFSTERQAEQLRTIFDQREGRLDMYVKLPELAAQVAPGKSWIKFDMLRELRRRGLTRGDLFTSAIQIPSTYLEALRAAHQDVEELGAETLRGEPVTHYRVRITTEDVVAAAPPEKRAALRRFITSGIRAVKSDIWVGDDGLIRRLAQRLEGEDRAGYTLTFHDWGAPFTLHLPPAGETADGNKLLAKPTP